MRHFYQDLMPDFKPQSCLLDKRNLHQFHLGVIIAALYWFSMLGASLLPGTRWVDPEFAKETRAILGMPPQLFLLCVLLALLIGSEILSFR